ncbi:MAG TPA: helix-turn-helix domain-containing protein [Burkholderiaceae bacterium]|jgi:cytoskeleton protein RodZ|nr:helix-turn-helix domain-containing protein [Burkholderiaceae bacterium]
MSEAPPMAEPMTDKTAGALLREARIAQGMHIAAMSAAIKVAQRKLELLEADRYDELPDATFTRALAQTMCRVLKVDAEPVLSRLPQPRPSGLEHVASGLNEPFRERPGRHEPRDWAALASPVVWGTALLLIAALVVFLLPPGLLTREPAAPSAPPASPPAAQPAVPPAAAPAVEVPASQALVAPPVPQAIEPAASAATAITVPVAAPPSASAAALQVRTSAASWLQVSDARGKVLIARIVQPGESLELDGAAPLRVRVGNASGTQLSFRGRPVNLAAARDNTANVELK